MLSDVWRLETNEEVQAADDLDCIVQEALYHNGTWQKEYLVELWDHENWESIQYKLSAEGSRWYVWWMDGVRQHALNIQIRNWWRANK